ncbi:hypothetical protein DMH04_03790 [Kibdelosporangium aridum]|uniref:Luciferase domain-containing protein n=1 Tax=Kibdelosporangium aridum TaxID=2030 RepID=A0A428ZRB6_KIBAR|nr:hypothetical protein DMH04_03790 [Kibdelosporangium aridum]
MTMPTLPIRLGERPKTGPEVPHVQLTQLGPQAIRDELTQWMSGRFPATVTGPSEISDPAKMRPWIAATFPDAPVADDIPVEKATALFLDGVDPAPGAVLLPPSLTLEFAHIHPDGSLHVALLAEDRHEVLDKGWGEPHPLFSPQVNVVMVYSPRTSDELHVAQTVLEASYRYAAADPVAIRA